MSKLYFVVNMGDIGYSVCCASHTPFLEKYFSKGCSPASEEYPIMWKYPEKEMSIVILLRYIAEDIVWNVRKGNNIVVITQSEYLLEKVNHFIMLSSIKPELRKTKYGYTEDTYLNIEEVEAYTLERHTDVGGFSLNKLEVNEEDGIVCEEFLKIHEQLYEECLMLRRDILGVKEEEE